MKEEINLLKLGFKKKEDIYFMFLGDGFELYVEKECFYLVGEGYMFIKPKYKKININSEKELKSFLKFFKNSI